MIVITPSLYAGTPNEAVSRDNTIWTDSPDEASHFIEEGGTAFIPLEDWQRTATQVLTRWATEDQIKTAIYFANTGSLPGGVDAW